MCFRKFRGITLSHLADISEELRLKNDDVLRLDQHLNDFSISYIGQHRLCKRKDGTRFFAGAILWRDANRQRLSKHAPAAGQGYDHLTETQEKCCLRAAFQRKSMLTDKFLAII